LSSRKEEFRAYSPSQIDVNPAQIMGEKYRNIIGKVSAIVDYQKRRGIKKGIKGFIFHGVPGTGKTTCAKAIARQLGSYLIFVDGSDIARRFYGESEQRITKIFEASKLYRHSIVLIDDCESVFPRRDWGKIESWHISQDNIFFHVVDSINTSKTITILTTNRFDLVDPAIIDRLYSIEFPLPEKQVLEDVAKTRAAELGMTPESLIQKISRGDVKTMRDLDKAAIEDLVKQASEEILSEPSGGRAKA
jgi:SpoVK/Ycf46/Vps4 family AAA+-type ATPase